MLCGCEGIPCLNLSVLMDFLFTVEISDLPPTLTFKILKPCMGTECLRIAVDCVQGVFLVSLANLGGKCIKICSYSVLLFFVLPIAYLTSGSQSKKLQL